MLGAGRDPVCPIEDRHDIVAGLPEELTEFETFDDASQILWDDAPGAYFGALRRFLQGLEPPRMAP